jgi:hypothetical protein
VDGLWQADWKITRGRGETILAIQSFIRLSRGEMDAIAVEGERLLDFAAPGRAGCDVRFVSVTE